MVSGGLYITSLSNYFMAAVQALRLYSFLYYSQCDSDYLFSKNIVLTL